MKRAHIIYIAARCDDDFELLQRTYEGRGYEDWLAACLALVADINLSDGYERVVQSVCEEKRAMVQRAFANDGYVATVGDEPDSEADQCAPCCATDRELLLYCSPWQAGQGAQ